MRKIRRKTVLHGPSTLTVSLPSNWVKRFDIKKGDELNVEECDKELRIAVEKEISLGKKEFDIRNLKRLVKTYVAASYRQGYDEIHIIYEDASTIQEVKDVVSKEITGFEVIKQDRNNCILKDLTGHAKGEFDTALRRIWLLILDLSEESLAAIKENNLSQLKNILLMDQSINKFSNYCLRLLTKQSHGDYKKTALYYHFVKSLEEIADRYKDLCNLYINNPEKIDKEFISAFKNVNQHLEEFYELFYTYNEQRMENLFKKIKLTYNKISLARNKREIYLSSVCKDITDLLEVIAEINL